MAQKLISAHWLNDRRTLDSQVDAMVVSGGNGLDAADKVTVKLISTDPQRGFIDFAA